jgi:hypothetical protein
MESGAERGGYPGLGGRSRPHHDGIDHTKENNERVTIFASALLAPHGSRGTLSAQDPRSRLPAADRPPRPTTAEAAPPAETTAAHDWEFAVGDGQGSGATGSVMVVDAESGSDFVLIASGLR